mmetsp:Transcript_6849/g.12775  ORF Transcript_6849/g.12775 Transcript_6849/m.12775 type:complete len:194 (-) Transcript_6849:18-599(-)
MVFVPLSGGPQCNWSGHAVLQATSFSMMTGKEPPQPEAAGPGGAQYGGLMSQGYVPPGQFEDLLNLIRQASAAAERAMNAAKYAEMAASASGVAGQQAVVRAMHMANAPGSPAPSPFSPGNPGEPGLGVKTMCGPEPDMVALVTDARVAALTKADAYMGPPEKRKRRVSGQEFLGTPARSDGSVCEIETTYLS